MNRFRPRRPGSQFVALACVLAFTGVSARTSASPALAMQAGGGERPLPWAHDWKAALARAAAEKKPLLVVVMKDGEPGCDAMLAKVYGDAEVRLKLANFVLAPASLYTHALTEIDDGGRRTPSCPQFLGALCSEHQAIERELHERLADPENGDVIAPQHLVFDGRGELLLRRPWEMKRQGFLEFLERALALHADPKAADQPGVRSAFVQKQLDAILKAKDADARGKATLDLLSESSPDREAAFLEAVEKSSGAENKEAVIRAAGQPDFKAWATTVAKLLDAKDAWVRDCAIVTLEEEASSEAGPRLLAQFAPEKDAEAKKDVLRALGPCGGGRKEIRALLLEQLDAAKESWRAAAALSLGFFLKGDAEVAAALEKRFAKEAATSVRLAVLAAFWQASDADQRSRVARMTKDERNEEVRNFAAILAVRLGGDPADLPKSVAAMKGIGPDGVPTPKQLLRMVAPIFEDDKVVRNRMKNATKAPVKGGKGS